MTANVTRGWAPLRGVLVGRDKYIDLPITELYDLGTDPRGTAERVRRPRRTALRCCPTSLKSFDVTMPGRPRDETAAVSSACDRSATRRRRAGPRALHRRRRSQAARRSRADDAPATEAFEGGRLDDAAGAIRSVMARRADMEDAYRYLAFIYWQQGKHGPGHLDARGRAPARPHAEPKSASSSASICHRPARLHARSSSSRAPPVTIRTRSSRWGSRMARPAARKMR